MVNHLNNKIRFVLIEIAKQGPTEKKSLQDWAEVVNKLMSRLFYKTNSKVWGIQNRTMGKLLGENPSYIKSTTRMREGNNVMITWYRCQGPPPFKEDEIKDD